MSLGSPDVCIAIIDSSCEPSHPALRGAHLEQLAISDDRRSTDHGTFIASILFGQTADYILGVVPKCRGILIAALDQSGRCDQHDLATSIDLAISQGAQVVNVSAGAASKSGRAIPELERAVKHAEEADVLLVAAAGNDGCPCLHVPGAVSSTLVVGAADSAGSPLPLSNWGAEYHDKGLLAPGLDIPGAGLSDGLIRLTGTSAASAITSGIAGLLLALGGPGISPAQVGQLLLDTSTDCEELGADDCRRVLRGFINVPRAMASLANASGEGEPNQEVRPMGEIENTAALVPPTEVSSAAGSSVTLQPAEGDEESRSPDHATESIDTSIVVRSEQRQSKASQSSDRHAPVRRSSSCECIPGPNGECTCPPQAVSAELVYAIGSLDIDFVSDSRFASIAQSMGEDPSNRPALVEFLRQNPTTAASIYWVLTIEEAPVYVIAPVGAFAQQVYEILTGFLADALEGASRVSVAGVAREVVQLRSGTTARALVPDVRGFANWTTDALIKAANPKGTAKRNESLKSFLERVYYELRNTGLMPHERALNYAATNAFNAASIFEDAATRNLELDSIEVERAPVARANSDVWDVKLSFFDPENTNRSRRAYRYTVDVADTLPSTIGDIRSWSER